jgi:hypothetical protein
VSDERQPAHGAQPPTLSVTGAPELRRSADGTPRLLFVTLADRGLLPTLTGATLPSRN